MSEQHWAWWDDLAQSHRRRTACGIWVTRDQVARLPDAVTCADCRAILQRFDNAAWDEGDDDESSPERSH